MNFDRKQFSIVLRKTIGNRSGNEYARQCGVDPAHVSRLLREKINAAPTPETIYKFASVAANDITYEDLMRAAGHLERRFTGCSLAMLRGDKSYRDYADYLKTNDIKVTPSMLEAYEKGLQELDEEIIKAIANLEGVLFDTFITSGVISEPQEEYKIIERSDFTFLEDDVYSWLKNPENADFIRFMHQAYKSATRN